MQNHDASNYIKAPLSSFSHDFNDLRVRLLLPKRRDLWDWTDDWSFGLSSANQAWRSSQCGAVLKLFKAWAWALYVLSEL